MALLAVVAARSSLTLAGSWGWVIEVAECYCSTSICRLHLINARPERSRQCQPQHRTPTSYWSLGGEGTWVCTHWSAVSQAAFFQEHTSGSRSTQPGERGKFLRWESIRATPEAMQRQQTALWFRKNQIWDRTLGFCAILFSLAGIRQAQQPSKEWVTTAVPQGLTLLSHFPPF